MPLEGGSRPEVMDFGEGAKQFEAKNWLEKEVEHLPGTNNWIPKKKCGIPDQRKAGKAYRDGYDRIWGNKAEE